MTDLDRLRDFLGETPTAASSPIAGLYFLFDHDALVYVGQSHDIVARISHQSKHLRFDRAFYVKESSAIRRLTREAELIGTFQPILNQQSKAFALARAKRGDALGRIGKTTVARIGRHQHRW